MIEAITGRYMRLDLEGRAHRLYFEEAGQGIPLLLLHTAGSDGRQWRGLVNDAEVTARFRCVTFDMPVSYTHLTLPTILRLQISLDA